MKVSVVVRSYNESAHIGKLLHGLAAQRLRPFEVIVVDSGSTDGTPDIARRLGARVISIDKQDFTFGRALNIGCEAATGDILVFASAHVFPSYVSWLETLTAPFADERVVLSYGRQRGDRVNKFSEHQVFERWFPQASACPQPGYFCNNANCAVRRTAWELQRYDETLTGLEDLAWAKAARERGGWIAYAADAEIIHVHTETWAQVRNRYRREALAMRHIDSHARFTPWDFASLFIANAVADLGTAVRDGVLRQEFASIVQFRFNQFWGTFRGYNGALEPSAALRKRFYYPALSGARHPSRTDLDALRVDYDAAPFARLGDQGAERS